MWWEHTQTSGQKGSFQELSPFWWALKTNQSISQLIFASEIFKFLLLLKTGSQKHFPLDLQMPSGRDRDYLLVFSATPSAFQAAPHKNNHFLLMI